MPSSLDTLLLCIDLQPAFLAAIPDGPRVAHRSAFAVEAAVGLGIPVLFTEQVPGKLGPTDPALLALAAPAETFGKDTFSALSDDKICRRLQEIGIEHLLLCGIETPVCVYQTALAARRNEYEVTILTDCVGARRADDAAAALAALSKAGCNLLPAETVFYAILHDARHPFFRAYTGLVKKYG
ncbi:MAG TPA: isochorismatase family protein [Opitutaceae bacterium]|nr:isochorismatase family protein [Opitutaceae bacterium]